MSNEAADAAIAALTTYMAAWNAEDVEGVRATLHFPHVMVGPAGEIVVLQTAADFQMDFARLREREGWRHSTFDNVAVVSSAPSKVHVQADFSRYREDGSKYGSGTVLYTITNHNGHWGLQVRSGMPDAALLRARE